MTVTVPKTTPAPTALVIFSPPTSSAAAGPPPPQPSNAPPAPGTSKSVKEDNHKDEEDDAEETGDGGDDDGFRQPKLRLEIRDLDHPGAAKFLDAVNAGKILSVAVGNVQRLLYWSPAEPHTTMPKTRSVTIILRDMGGVAYTTGTDLDSDHKEIHFSLGYINGISPASRLTAEITGVLTHELVHCYQWDAKGTCPGGLVEGIADWVRLNCDLSPPHWKRETAGEWDRGYQHTAYFLDYIENRFGAGSVRRINEKLRRHKYNVKPFWTELLGRPVEQLWQDYVEKQSKENEKC